MATHFEQSLQQDLDGIRGKIGEMAAVNVRILRDCVKALRERNRVLAFSVILRDERIDGLEKEVDRLCLEFIVRQQPVAGLLRLAYATIRINLELERVGDYAEGIARQVLKLTSTDVSIPVDRYEEIANLAIPMLEDSVKAFVNQDAALARKTIETEEKVDALKSKLNADIMRLARHEQNGFESLNALMMIARHFERVSDQAKNICTEVLYMCTGEYNRHEGTEASRLIFVDGDNSCRSQMAEAIAKSLNHSHLIIASAGLEPGSIDARTVSFLKGKGLDITKYTSKRIDRVPSLDRHQVIVALAPEARKAFPKVPTKAVCLDWSMSDPSTTTGSPSEIAAAYENTYQFLRAHIADLVEALIGDKTT